jgi:hypothetical protein
MCDHTWLDTGHTMVCCNCGVERQVLVLNVWNKFSAPLNRQYDRVGRFKTKVDKLLGTHRGPRYSDPVWTELEQARRKGDRGTMGSPDDVRRVIRKSKLKTKHYDCVRIFCDVFTTFRLTPLYLKQNTERTREQLMHMFGEIHHVWLGCNDTSDGFFSYDFLLRFFLERMNSPLVVYLKPKTNKRRLQKYVEKLTRLSQCGNGTYCQNSGGSHFLSELKRSMNLQSRLP